MSDKANMQTTVLKKVVKKPIPTASEQNRDVDPNKKSTKTMLQEALEELKSRKGVSYYAIKKYIADNNNVDINKVKHIIKKQLKSGVEEGTIVQMKGVGASGSFKLVPKKQDKSKTTQKTNKPDKIKKSAADGSKKSIDDGSKKSKDDGPKKSTKQPIKPAKNEKTGQLKRKNTKSKSPGSSKAAKIKKVKTNLEDKIGFQTPSKKKTLSMKRKSIGSIIKPPKMKPKAK